MQRRKRYSRNRSSVRQVTRHFASACFQRIAFLLLFCIFTSCTHHRKDSHFNQLLILNNELSKLCLDAEGKARLELGSNKYLFNFESVLKSEERSWLVAAHIPLQGEELLGINYGQGSEAEVVGNFLTKIQAQAEKKNTKERMGITLADYKRAFSKFGQVLFFLDHVSKGEEQLKELCHVASEEKGVTVFSCTPSSKIKEKFSASIHRDHLVFRQELTQDKALELSFSSANQKYYERMQLSFKGYKQKFDMFFFHSSCAKSLRGDS